MRGQRMPQDLKKRLLGTEESGANGHHPELRRTLTDYGNAERFTDEHGGRARYCWPWNKWLTYDDRRWAYDDTGEVERMMKAAVRNIYREAAESDDEKERKALADHAKRSESKKRVTDALYLARSEPGIAVTPEQFDADPWLLNVENGTVDLRTGDLRPHSPADLITKLAPVHYDPDAPTSLFEMFLEEILPSEALRRFVQRVVGYAATGTVSEEILVILHGCGANGKSTLVNAIMAALGDYAMQAAPDLLLLKRNSHPTELADLLGARFVASVEIDEDRRLAEGLVKQLTGRDPIKARRMREDFWQFDPTHTVFLATNHKPEVRGTDHAIWRRIRLVPFEVTFSEEEQDTELPEKLLDELPGILAWIVKGCLDWRREGLVEPDEVRAATADYREEMDVLGAFFDDRCVLSPDVRAQATALYNAYKDWADQSGERAETQTRFGRRLKERGFQRKKIRGVYWWAGLGLQSDGDDPEGGDRFDEGDSSGPDIGISTENPVHEALNPKKGPKRSTVPPNGPPEASDDSEDDYDRMVAERMADLDPDDFG